MLELAVLYLLVHMLSVYVGFSLVRMDETRSRRFFPLAAWSGIPAGLLHWAVDSFLGKWDNITEALMIGGGAGLITLLIALPMLKPQYNRAVIVASTVCFIDLVLAMMLLR